MTFVVECRLFKLAEQSTASMRKRTGANAKSVAKRAKKMPEWVELVLAEARSYDINKDSEHA